MSTAVVPKKKMSKQRKLMLLKDNLELYSLFIPAFVVEFILGNVKFHSRFSVASIAGEGELESTRT